MSGRQALEAARDAMEARHAAHSAMSWSASCFGGRPVTDYANDFWLVTGAEGGDPVGYVTSPWFSPELETNIALAYVPWEMRDVGTKLKVHLPPEYAERAGEGAPAEVVDVPFRPSVNPNARGDRPQQGSRQCRLDSRMSIEVSTPGPAADVAGNNDRRGRACPVPLSGKRAISTRATTRVAPTV